MKLFILAFVAGIGFKTGEILLDYLIGLIPRKRKRNRISYRDYYSRD